MDLENNIKTERELLLDANSMLRSFYHVIERKGEQTNWEALRNRVKTLLNEQHSVLLPDWKKDIE